MRLDKYLALSRIGTRSEVRSLIKKASVSVNGAVVKDPALHVEETDEVCVGGKKIVYKEHGYYMLNKPAGVVSATEDAEDKTVIDLFPQDMRPRLFPAGRLDKDSVGLLLITDDGDLSHRLMSPKDHVEKRYLIKTDEPLDEEDIRAFSDGITLSDGTQLMPAKLEISDTDKRMATVTVCEGKYHQVKRMTASRGKKVLYLKRVSIGRLVLDPGLEEGSFRELTDEETELLKNR